MKLFNFWKKEKPIEPIKKFNYRNFVKNKYVYRTNQNYQNLISSITEAENYVNPNRFLLLQIYKMIELDSTIMSLINQRLLALMNYEIVLTDENDEVVVDDFFKSERFKKIVKLIHDTNFYGYSVFQVNDDSSIEMIPREFYRPDTNSLTDSQTSSGNLLNVNEIDNVYAIERYENYLGDFVKIAKLFFIKDVCESNFAEFVEKYGTPVAVVKSDSKNESRQDLAEMLENLGGSSWAILDKDDDFQMLSTDLKGEVFSQLLNYVNEMLSIAILGQTLTSQSQTGGTEQLGKIHSKILTTIIESDKDFIENTFNSSLLDFLKTNNLIDQSIVNFKMKTKVSDLQFIETVKKLKEIGYEVDNDYIQTIVNLPMKK